MRKLFLIGLLACAFAGNPNDAAAESSNLLNFQGRIKATGGAAVTKTMTMTFKIYSQEVGGDALWYENDNAVKVDNGFFNVYLGSSSDLTLDFSQELWLEVTLDNGDVLPRTRISANPYSFQAGLANNSKDVVDGVLTWAKFTTDAKKAGGMLKGTYPNPELDPSKLANNSIPGDKIAAGDYTHFRTAPTGPAFGDMEGSNFPNLYIANNKIANKHLQENAVTFDKIGSGAAQKDYILASDGNGNTVWQEETDPAVQSTENFVPRTNADGDLVNGSITDANHVVTVSAGVAANDITIDAHNGKVSTKEFVASDKVTTKQLGVGRIVMTTATVADQAALEAAFAASTTVFNIDGIGNFTLPTAGVVAGQVVYVHVNSFSAVVEGNNLMQYETATFVYMGNNVWAKF